MNQTRIDILYCEDDETIRELFCPSIIRAFPRANLVICSDGIEGKKKISYSDFQLVISDFQMGVEGGDGISLYKAFRERNPNALFIIFSGQPESEFSECLMDKNFLYFSKGGTLEEEFETKIKKHFNRAAA